MRARLVPIGGPPEVVDLVGGGGLRFMRSLRALISVVGQGEQFDGLVLRVLGLGEVR